MNSIFYAPNMVQYTSRPAFLGKNMDNKYKDKIISELEKKVVPEFGQFEPISVIFNEADDSRFTFTVKPNDTEVSGKDAIFSFFSGNTARMAVTTRNFANKTAVDEYLKSLSDEDVDNIKKELKKKTEK